MDNLITVFMDYKVNRLTEYGIFALQEDNEFLRQVLHGYFRVYVDNRYYSIFHTLDDNSEFNEENLKLEFKGIMEEMLDDYREYELQVSNEEYNNSRKLIQSLNPVCMEILKIDDLSFKDKDDIPLKVFDFVQNNPNIKQLVGDRENQLAKLIRDTYTTCMKLLNYKDGYYHIEEKKFLNKPDKVFLELVPDIKVLGSYRKSMVTKIYQDSRLEPSKIDCLIQKISLEILKKSLNHEEIPLYFMEIGNSSFARGNIQNNVLSLLDNPLFKRYVVLAVNYNTYLSQKGAFTDMFRYACMQDFTHIIDIYQKTDNISKEGVFPYLIVCGFKFQDRDFFVNYESETMETLVFEEE